MKNTLKILPVAVALLTLVKPALSAEIYQDGNSKINANLQILYGLMDSQERYYGSDSGGTHWSEGSANYGLSASHISGYGSLNGELSFVSSATWGDGDAAGYSSGNERKTTVENAWFGWKSAQLFPWLGEDGVDLSFGSQAFHLGDGFLITDDSANSGNAPAYGGSAGELANRGGGYYIAPRHAFKHTAVAKIGGTEGLHGQLAWIKSNNAMQASTELVAGELAYTQQANTLGLQYIHVIDVNAFQADTLNPSLNTRKGMNVYSLRGETDGGIKNARFAFDYALQDKKYELENYQAKRKDNSDQAWFLSAGYNFNTLPWKPGLSYRYSRFSRDWDPFFNGVDSAGLGTWLLGEVAGNFGGPFNSNAQVHFVALHANPIENLTLGALMYKFDTLSKQGKTNYDGHEIDIYAQYDMNQYFSVIPIIGWYNPEKSAEDGGSQIGSAKTNRFAALIFSVRI